MVRTANEKCCLTSEMSDILKEKGRRPVYLVWSEQEGELGGEVREVVRVEDCVWPCKFLTFTLGKVANREIILMKEVT